MVYMFTKSLTDAGGVKSASGFNTPGIQNYYDLAAGN